MIWIIEKKSKQWYPLTGPDSRVFDTLKPAQEHRDRLRTATGIRYGYRVAAFTREGDHPGNLAEMMAGKAKTPWDNSSLFCDKPPKGKGKGETK